MSERERDGGGPARPEGTDGDNAGRANPGPEMTDGQQASAADPFDGLVLDDDFVRGATQSEPSARARMLAERWKREPPDDTGFRDAAAHPTARPGRLRRRRDDSGWGGRDRTPRPRGGRDRTELKIAVTFVLIAGAILFLSVRGGA